jgi:hypothetical protein
MLSIINWRSIMFLQGYIIKRTNSHFTDRNGREDCKIMKKGDWGSRELDGKLYNTIMIFDCKTGEIVRDYGTPLPETITPKLLKQWGFIDKIFEG